MLQLQIHPVVPVNQSVKVYPASTFTINGQYTFEATDGVFENSDNSVDFQFTIVGASGQGAEITAGVTNEENLGPPSQATIARSTEQRSLEILRAAQNIKTKNDKNEDVTREQKLNLVAMIYKLEGTTQLEKLVKQTEDDKTHNVLLQTESNFLNYMNFGNLRSQDRATQDEHKIPLKIAKVQTDCKYQAPTLAVGTDIGGPNVRGEELAFVLSNPPFIHCGPESDRAKYSINFGISNGDYTKFTKTKFSDPQNVRFEITQIVGGNNLVKLD